MVADDLHISDERFAGIISTCDASLACLGEAFFAPEFDRYFDREMLQLLQDARKAWV